MGVGGAAPRRGIAMAPLAPPPVPHGGGSPPSAEALALSARCLAGALVACAGPGAAQLPPDGVLRAVMTASAAQQLIRAGAGAAAAVLAEAPGMSGQRPSAAAVRAVNGAVLPHLILLPTLSITSVCSDSAVAALLTRAACGAPA